MAKEAGHETSLCASCDFLYRRMSEFFAEPEFDAVELFRYERQRWPEADTDAIQAIRDKLEAAVSPQFAVAFLMSTHYDYQYPEELEAMDVASIVDPAMVKNAEQRTQRISRTRYQKSLAFMDQMLGDFVESLDMENNIVIITGDHGESIWEDGTIAHGSRLSEIQTRVPMIVRGAGIPSMRRTTPSSHIDLLPTLATRLGVNITGPGQHGIDWFGDSTNGPRLLVHEYPDTWDVALIDETLATDGEKLLVNIDRATGVTRVVGFVGDEGVVESKRKKTPTAAEDWSNSFQAVLDRIAPQ
jgi:membrane-anchored protein YejM (alkaline phosphatase superfamily)